MLATFLNEVEAQGKWPRDLLWTEVCMTAAGLQTSGPVVLSVQAAHLNSGSG